MRRSNATGRLPLCPLARWQGGGDRRRNLPAAAHRTRAKKDQDGECRAAAVAAPVDPPADVEHASVDRAPDHRCGAEPQARCCWSTGSVRSPPGRTRSRPRRRSSARSSAALVLFGWSAALFYHLCSGIRHLAVGRRLRLFGRGDQTSSGMITVRRSGRADPARLDHRLHGHVREAVMTDQDDRPAHRRRPRARPWVPPEAVRTTGGCSA